MEVVVLKNIKMNINDLQSKFPALLFKSMGSLSKYPSSSHYHISSTEYKNSGIVEVTFFKDNGNSSVEIKLASNRVGTWGQKGFALIKETFSK